MKSGNWSYSGHVASLSRLGVRVMLISQERKKRSASVLSSQIDGIILQ